VKSLCKLKVINSWMGRKISSIYWRKLYVRKAYIAHQDKDPLYLPPVLLRWCNRWKVVWELTCTLKSVLNSCCAQKSNSYDLLIGGNCMHLLYALPTRVNHPWNWSVVTSVAGPGLENDWRRTSLGNDCVMILSGVHWCWSSYVFNESIQYCLSWRK
jgi:hypothetical protein